MKQYTVMFIIFLLLVIISILYIDRYNNINKSNFLQTRLDGCEQKHVLKMLNKELK